MRYSIYLALHATLIKWKRRQVKPSIREATLEPRNGTFDSNLPPGKSRYTDRSIRDEEDDSRVDGSVSEDSLARTRKPLSCTFRWPVRFCCSNWKMSWAKWWPRWKRWRAAVSRPTRPSRRTRRNRRRSAVRSSTWTLRRESSTWSSTICWPRRPRTSPSSFTRARAWTKPRSVTTSANDTTSTRGCCERSSNCTILQTWSWYKLFDSSSGRSDYPVRRRRSTGWWSVSRKGTASWTRTYSRTRTPVTCSASPSLCWTRRCTIRASRINPAWNSSFPWTVASTMAATYLANSLWWVQKLALALSALPVSFVSLWEPFLESCIASLQREIAARSFCSYDDK